MQPTSWRRWWDVFFPPQCVRCGGVPAAGGFRHVCRRCALTVVRVIPPHCETCGHPFDGPAGSDVRCTHCEGLDPRFDRGCTAVLARGAARDLIHTLKYRKGREVIEDAERLFGGSPECVERARGAVLVPVPLHPRKFRERGFNQSLDLARALARAAGGGATVRQLLVRVVDTESQTHLDRGSRRANLKNAFAVVPEADITPSLRHVLVDDVFTTGSTLNACAAALRRGGAGWVEVITLAHG